MCWRYNGLVGGWCMYCCFNGILDICHVVRVWLLMFYCCCYIFNTVWAVCFTCFVPLFTCFFRGRSIACHDQYWYLPGLLLLLLFMIRGLSCKYVSNIERYDVFSANFRWRIPSSWLEIVIKGESDNQNELIFVCRVRMYKFTSCAIDSAQWEKKYIATTITPVNNKRH